jgi:hypothetical protein
MDRSDAAATRSRRIATAAFWLVILSQAFSGIASAAELRGRILNAPTGAELKLNCGGKPNPHPLGGSGSYSIRNVPSGNCKLTVTTSSGTASRTIAINKPVVKFSGEIRAIGNGIVLIPR